MKETKTSRRTALKSIAAMVGPVSLIREVELVSAEEPSINAGRTDLVELNLSYYNAPETPRSIGKTPPRYITGNNGIYMLQYDPLVENDSLLVAGRSFHPIPAEPYGSKERRTIPLTDSFQSNHSEHLSLEEPLEYPSVNVLEVRNKNVELKIGDERYEVKADSEEKINLDAVTIKRRKPSEESEERAVVRDSKEETVTALKPGPTVSDEVVPSLAVRYRSEQSIYGRESHIVLPTTSDDWYVNSILKDIEESNTEVKSIDGKVISIPVGGAK